MINYEKLNGIIVSRETLSHMKNDPRCSELYMTGQTAMLDAYRIVLTTGERYRVYTYGGYDYGEK